VDRRNFERYGTRALPWVVLAGFIRISTNPRIMSVPLTLDQAIGCVDEWLALPMVRVIGPTSAHQQVFTRMLRAASATGNLVSDAHLAALATEHGCSLASTDDDFQKFPWVALAQSASELRILRLTKGGFQPLN
jgi:uncharacterized protein